MIIISIKTVADDARLNTRKLSIIASPTLLVIMFFCIDFGFDFGCKGTALVCKLLAIYKVFIEKYKLFSHLMFYTLLYIYDYSKLDK